MKLNELFNAMESELDLSDGYKMIYDLFKRDFARNPWIALYHLDEWNLKIDEIPGLRDLLNQYKKPIITSLLKSMKDDRPETPAAMEMAIARLEKIKADWPEIAVLRKSLASDRHPIDESADLMQGVIIDLLKAVTGMWYPRKQVEAGLDDKKADIIGELQYEINERWSWSPITRVLRTLRTLGALAFYGRDWPELTEMLDSPTTKKNIIKALLSMSKSESWDPSDVEELIGYLRAVHVDWPELDAISSKLNESQEAPSDEAAQIEYVRAKPGRIADMQNPSKAVQLAAVQQYGLVIGKIKDPDEDVQQAAVEEDGISIVMIDNPSPKLWAVPSVKKKVIGKLLSWVKREKYAWAKDMLDHLVTNGCPWPELGIISKQLEGVEIDESKIDWGTDRDLGDFPASVVMDRIRDGQLMALYNGVQDLRYDGIKDSIILGAIEPHDEEIARWADDVLTKWHNNDNLIFSIVRLFEMGGKFPHLAAALTKHRNAFIRYLLKQYKAADKRAYKSVAYINLLDRIKSLKVGGLDWPELDSIYNSAQRAKEEPRGV